MKIHIRYIALALALLFVSTAFAGCAVDWSQYQDVIPVGGGNYKYIALTFDDGPHEDPAKTKAIVDKLKSYGGEATFFVLGSRINVSTGEVMKYAVDNGCEIGIHGYSHEVYFNNCTDAEFESELSRTHALIKQYTGKDPTLFRPVGGAITDARVKSCGYATILWNLDSSDWEHKACPDDETEEANIKIIVNNVVSNAEDGDIVLFHDIYNNSAKAALRVIDELYSKGYRFVTVSELLDLDKNSAGQKYFSK